MWVQFLCFALSYLKVHTSNTYIFLQDNKFAVVETPLVPYSSDHSRTASHTSPNRMDPPSQPHNDPRYLPDWRQNIDSRNPSSTNPSHPSHADGRLSYHQHNGRRAVILCLPEKKNPRVKNKHYAFVFFHSFT